MEYNVGGWYIGTGTNVPTAKDEQYYNLQNEIIGGENADILCLCEYWDIFSQSGRTAKSLLEQYYPYIETRNGTSTYFGRAVCSKYPIVSYTANEFLNDEGRYYDEAVIDINGEEISVIVTHFHPSDNEKKKAEATQLYEYVSNIERKYIICGDFNSTLKKPFSEMNTAIYQQFIDAGDKLANDGAFGIIPTYKNGTTWEDAAAIDNIIVSRGFTIESATNNLLKVTDNIGDTIDHVPLIANVKYRKETPMPTYPTTLSATDANAPTLSAATRADEEAGTPHAMSEAAPKGD